MFFEADSEISKNNFIKNWICVLQFISNHYRIDISPGILVNSEKWMPGNITESTLFQLSKKAGLKLNILNNDISPLNNWRLPAVVIFKNGQLAIITDINKDDITLSYSGELGLSSTIRRDELQVSIVCVAILRPLKSMADSRIESYLQPVEKNWIKSLVFADKKTYQYIFITSTITNTMALGGIIFSMQVYDRVIPAQSESTLYVLFIGVIISILFAWFMRNARSYLTDLMGKKIDLVISDRVFGHALRIKNSMKPKGTGTLISQIKELESIREMSTSTTIAAVADIPFFILFCFVFWSVSGWLVIIPFVAFIFLILPSLILQNRLRTLAKEGMRESALRNSMLVEAIQGMEDIKILQAEPKFQNEWNYYNTVNSESSVKLRQLLGKLNNWILTIQSSAFVFVIFLGAPHVISGEMTTGVLVAASILSSRMLAPLSSVAQLLNRWQQAKMSSNALDKLMAMSTDYPDKSHLIHRSHLDGNFNFFEAAFSYDGKDTDLFIKSLAIKKGEKIAILGKNGAGKSTFLQALSGLIEPISGKVLVDGVNLIHIDPTDVRRNITLLTQQARLFYGSIKENLLLGMPDTSDDKIIDALKASGAWEFICGLNYGWDHILQEDGIGLSGGQKQSLLIARTLLREPSVLLLDEPTASLDEVTESTFINNLEKISSDKTLIIATHRRSILNIVERIIILDNGNIALDGEKNEILAMLTK